jgi:hypothetical protein
MFCQTSDRAGPVNGPRLGTDVSRQAIVDSDEATVAGELPMPSTRMVASAGPNWNRIDGAAVKSFDSDICQSHREQIP